MAESQLLFDYTGYLPECPTWSEAEQVLYWVDIMEREIHRYDTRSGKHQVLQFPEEIGCLFLCEKGGFIVALRSGIWLTDAHGLLRRKVCNNPSNPELARFDDGGTNREGCFYADTFWGPGNYNGTLLMRVDNDLKPKTTQYDIHGANGLVFNTDQRWMYTSGIPNAVIHRTSLDERSEPGRREMLRRLQPGEGIPDGAVTDVEGCYWSAMFDGWRIARSSPQDKELETYPIPVRCPTMACFGGADTKTLYIITTRENMEDGELAKYPLSGTIFTLPVAVVGMKKLPFHER